MTVMSILQAFKSSEITPAVSGLSQVRSFISVLCLVWCDVEVWCVLCGMEVGCVLCVVVCVVWRLGVCCFFLFFPDLLSCAKPLTVCKTVCIRIFLK